MTLSGAWSVAITSPQRESCAADHIIDQGFDVFYPRLKRIFVRHGKKTIRIDPLFPRYLFVLVHDAWRALLGTRDVVDVIRSAEQPVLVSQKIVDDVKSRCDREGMFIVPKKRFNLFRKGASVRPKFGPFYGITGLYDGSLAHEREAALFNLLGREVRVCFKQGDLTAA